MQCLDEQEVIDLTSDEDEVAVVDAAMNTGRTVGTPKNDFNLNMLLFIKIIFS